MSGSERLATAIYYTILRHVVACLTIPIRTGHMLENGISTISTGDFQKKNKKRQRRFV